MSGVQVNNGKAFEYACLESIYNLLSSAQEVIVEDTPQLETARRHFESAPPDLRNRFVMAANAATRVVVRLEPQLEYPDRNIPLFLSLQADSQGQLGDVRDVLCIRKQNEWEIGLSCKHNHRAVKHSRLSATIDFGFDWFGIPASQDYFRAVTPIFDELRSIRESSDATALWSNIDNKAEKYYAPVLNAFMEELLRLDKANPTTIPEKLIRYLIGKNDFYKVITDSARKTTRVEAINISGTLNRPSEGKQSIVNITRLNLPTRLHGADFKARSNDTIEIALDKGWAISMRLYNESSHIEPTFALEFDFASVPYGIHIQVEPWLGSELGAH